VISFDQIATRLRETPVGKGACFGHHRQLALAVMLRCHERVPSLIRAEMSELLQRDVRHAVSLLMATQFPDGSWPANWTGATPYSDGESLLARLISTGHALEWLSCSERGTLGMQPAIEAAETWLCQRILDLNESELSRNYSAVSHAVFALMCLSEPSDPSRHEK
jgi:hypothetical protein